MDESDIESENGSESELSLSSEICSDTSDATEGFPWRILVPNFLASLHNIFVTDKRLLPVPKFRLQQCLLR